MTASTPPAWHWLDECDVPVQAYQWMTPKTPSGALSADSRNLSDSATLGVQNDSNQCANGAQCPPSALIPSDQCDECRSAPGRPHAPDCDVSSGPDISCDRKDDAESLGLLRGVIHDHFGAQATVECEGTAQLCDSVSNAAIEYVDEGPSVPFPVQSWTFEALIETEIDHLHEIIDDHHDEIVEMARKRHRHGFVAYGSKGYQWDAKTRLRNVLEELSDAPTYLTMGPIE